MPMPTFPLPVLPSAPWRNLKKSRNAHFGAPRNAGFPVHAACDLIAPPNTPVLAVDEGTILRFYSFPTSRDEETIRRFPIYAMDVQHPGFIVRYGEIARNLPPGIRAGVEVQEGQVIASIAAQSGGAMLHFEMFKDRDRADEILTDRSHATVYRNVPQANYERRNDVMDPTPYLDAWSWDLRVKLRRTMDLSFDMDD
jgi:murein DD-endopeptidase MepM/ murein hydrolase activator NlpD